MKYINFLWAILPSLALAQHPAVIAIRSQRTLTPIRHATIEIKKVHLVAMTDSAGLALFDNLPQGKFEIEISAIGYKDTEKELAFPFATADTLTLYLEPAEQELEEVIVKSARSNRSIKNTPSRIEIIAEEEIHEESTMRPGDIKMLLAESTGIQTQQTSAINGNAGIRIQGLDGRYTQILRDGFPVYSGAASGLGLLQIPPLDLQQVEIIKSASSTLYGGGAIAGIVNLITKTPGEKKDLNFHFNATSAGGIDISGFYSERFKKTGVTVFASGNTNKAYDPAGIGFSAIPQFERYTINPTLFYYFNDKTALNFGINSTFENRLGGDMQFIAGEGDSVHSYFERDKTKRISTQLNFEHKLTGKSSLTIKNSVSYFNRIINSKDYTFDGTQYSSFTEASYANKTGVNDWNIGINILTDNFREAPIMPVPSRNYALTTIGAFAQSTWNGTHWLTIETGFRADYIKSYGIALLPRIAALVKISGALTSRIGGGLGYKVPGIFTEETEKILYQHVLPVNSTDNSLEKSYGANWDLNYKTKFDGITVSVSQFFFYTYLQHPLFLNQVPNNLFQLQNSRGYLVSKGAETNIKLGYDEMGLYLGYTYTHASIYNNGTMALRPLIPKHRFNAALVCEAEGKWKFGSELYYFSKQLLSDGTEGRGYWLAGLVAEKIWKHFSLFINFENLGNTRQTKFGNIYTGTVSNPVFEDIYAPLDGFIVNGGLKVKL